MTRKSSWWAVTASVAAHLAVLAAAIWLMAPFAVTPAPSMPQIELLPPLPVPSTPEEAKPSPVQIVPQSKPAPAPVAAKVPVTLPSPPETRHEKPVKDTILPPDTKPATAQPQPKEPLQPPAAKPIDQPETPRVVHTESPQAEMELPAPPPPKPKVRMAHRAPTRQRLVANQDPQPTKTPPASAPINGNEVKKQTVIADSARPAAPAGPPPDYIGLIRARLEKVKHYPADARSRAEQGTPYVRFVLDRSGRLLSSHLEKPSGVSALDDEAEAMVQQAAPFPPFPASMQQTRLELIVPIQFLLKDADG